MSAPEDIHILAQQRAQARVDRDFARADELRDLIDDAGWRVIDTPEGFRLEEKPPFDVLSGLTEPLTEPVVHAPLVICVILDGWPHDVRECVQSLIDHAPGEARILLLDCGNVDGVGLLAEEWVSSSPGRVHVLHFSGTVEDLGWANLISAAIDSSAGEVFAIMDMSTIVEGDAFTTLLAELDAPGVVATGWQGANVDVDDAWRSFTPGGLGEVDAVLGYLMVFRRSAIEHVRPDPKARFYRNADMEWSLALREAGGRIRIPDVPLPIRQGRHHGYHDSNPEYRDKQSKKTYDRLLQRFRGKEQILAPR